jgi:hypothetical protein
LLFLFSVVNLISNLLRFRAAKTFCFGITVFLYQNKNPVAHLSHWRQFCAPLKCVLISRGSVTL